MKKQINYKTMDSLRQVKTVIDEATESIKDRNRIKVSNDVKEIIGAVVGAGTGVGAGVLLVGGLSAAGTSGAAALTSGLAASGAIVGGGMMAGIFVASAPVAVLGIAGYGLVCKINKNKIQKHKELLLKEAVAKHNKILEALSKKANQSEERINHLIYLNAALRKIIENIESDLCNASIRVKHNVKTK